MGRMKGSKNKIKSDPAHPEGPPVADNGFKHLFSGYEDVYKWICETAPDHVQSPVQRLVALCKRAKDITEIKNDRRKEK